jgi:hypothetical protein
MGINVEGWWSENTDEKLKYLEEACPMSLFPPQIPHDLTWD